MPDSGAEHLLISESQEWNGIVRELMDRKADLAVAPMTINFAR